MAYEWSRFLGGGFRVGTRDTTTKQTISIDSAFVFETSGDAWFVRFVSPVSQTTASLTLYVFCDSETGSPTDVRVAAYNGPAVADDADNPESGGSELGVSGAVDFNGTGGTWVAMTIASVTLVEEQSYYLVVDNRTGTPASNYPTLVTRGFLRLLPYSYFGGGFTTDGFLGAAPSIVNGLSAVIAFGDGSLLGNPYPTSNSEGSSSDDIGNRFLFDEDVIVSGEVLGTAADQWRIFEINAASGGANQITATRDRNARMKASGTRFAPTTLTGGTSYDCVIVKNTAHNTTVAYMGEISGNLPADVLACRMNGAGLVSGTTPGSYTLDNTKFLPMELYLDTNPAISGGSASGVRNPLVGPIG